MAEVRWRQDNGPNKPCGACGQWRFRWNAHSAVEPRAEGQYVSFWLTVMGVAHVMSSPSLFLGGRPLSCSQQSFRDTGHQRSRHPALLSSSHAKQEPHCMASVDSMSVGPAKLVPCAGDLLDDTRRKVQLPEAASSSLWRKMLTLCWKWRRKHIARIVGRTACQSRAKKCLQKRSRILGCMYACAH